MTSCTLIEDTNLSHAWVRLFWTVRSQRIDPLAPIFVSITGYSAGLPSEDPDIPNDLDSALAVQKKVMPSIAETASTIFPYKSWVRQGRPRRDEFFAWYIAQRLPRLRARNAKNVHGTYFERMIGFTKDHEHNQLESIILQYKSRIARGVARPRRSALQAVIVDPLRDLTGQALRGFPCLHQVSFTYNDDDGLAVCAYYPSQFIFQRAYGNYLGLSHLGTFIAHELDLKMSRLSCMIGHVADETPSAKSIRGLLDRGRQLTAERE
jgi:hypothetical protein